MDTVFKVCDALENVTFSASTVVPKCFVCVAENEDDDHQDPTFMVSNCGNLTSKYASHDMDFGVDDNSVCVQTGEDEPANSEIASIGQYRNFRDRQRTGAKSPLHVNETLGKESSWASIDGKKSQRKFEFSSSEHSKPVDVFEDLQPPTDEDNTTHDNDAYCDESAQFLADRIDPSEAGSDGDPVRMTVNLEKDGLDVFGLPLTWTHVVKKKSSWSSSSSHKTSSTSSSSKSSTSNSISNSSSSNSSSNSSGGNALKNRRDDHNSIGQTDSHSMHDSLGEHHQEILKKSSLVSNKGSDILGKEDVMLRELPSFGKSREFRSFGSNKSLEDANSYSLKPTYMTARESKQLHEESSRYKYILQRTPSDRSSTTSPSVSHVSSHQNQHHEYTTTTTTPSSHRPTVSASPKPRTSFETTFRTPFPKLYS